MRSDLDRMLAALATAAYVVVERTNRNGRTVRTAINPSLIK